MAITLKKTNFAKGTLASDIAIDANSLSLQTGEGAKFPQTGNFRAVLWSASYAAPESDANREIVEATLTSGDTFSITRAKEGTTAKAWSTNDNFALVFTKETLDEIETEINTKASLTGAETLTNKRITPRVYSTTSTSSLTPDSDSYDIIDITALAENITINNPSGTPNNGQRLTIIIKDNGTVRTISWGTAYKSVLAPLPTSTIANIVAYVELIYNSNTSTWDCILSKINAITISSTPAQGDILYYDGTQWNRLPAGTAGQFLKTQGAGANPIWAEGLNYTLNTVASDTLQHSNDTERELYSYGTWSKIKEIKLNEDLPACRIKFDIKNNGGTQRADGRIYKNGVAIGTIRSTFSDSYTTFSEDFTGFLKDDLIQIYVYGYAPSPYVWVRNMRLCFDGKITKFGGRTLVTPLSLNPYFATPPTNQDP